MNSWTLLALVVLAAGLGVLWWKRSQASRDTARRPSSKGRPHQSLDTVQAWEPHATRILSRGERDAYAVLARALPDHMVLAQVPLARFLKVPTRYSYSEWMKRVGSLSADLVVCDRTSEVVAVVEVRSERDSERSAARLERMRRVLQAAEISMLVWDESALPSPVQARQQLLGEDAADASAPSAADAFTRPGELLDPPPSTWFDELDTPPSPGTPVPPAR